MRWATGALLAALLQGREEGGTDPEAATHAGLRATRARASERLALGDPTSAYALCGEVLAEGPEEDACVSIRVRAKVALGRPREALAEARAFSSAHPESVAGRRILGEALYRAGRLDEAARVLQEAADGGPASARALLFLGLARAAEGRDEEAAAHFARALSLSPEDRDVLFHASEAAPDRARAVELLERYLRVSDGDDPDRIEGARGTIRVYRALGERSVWISESRPDRVEVELVPLAGREGRNRGYVVEADLGLRKKTRLLLDTGSSGLFLLERIASKAGLAPLAEETVFAGGGEGRHASRRGLLPSIAIGDLRFRDALVVTTRSEIEPTGRYHGILGLSAFQGYLVTLDLGRRRLVLERAAAQGSGAPYWTVSGQMLVAAEMEGAGPGLFLFDTGASRSQIALGRVAEIEGAGFGPSVRVEGFGGSMAGARSVRGVRGTAFGLGSFPPEMVAVDFAMRSRLGGVEVSGALGLDALDGRTIVVDTASRRIEISTPAGR